MSTDIENVLSLMSDKIARLEADLLSLKGLPSQAASFNPIAMANVGRNVNGLVRHNDYYTHVYGTGTITIPNTSWTAIPFAGGVRSISNGSMWMSQYPNRIWCWLDGWVDFDAVVQLPVTSGMIGAYFRANGTTQISEMSHASGTLGSSLHVHFSYPMRSGDYIELMVLQTTGVSKNVTITAYTSPEIRAIYRPININPTVGTAKTIMACGDSKTAIADGRWRILIQDMMMAANKRVTWVGVVNGRAGGDYYGFDTYHSAASGGRVAEIRALVAGTTTTIVNSGITITPGTIGTAPDVIVMWLGTNDLRAGTAEATIEASYTGMINDMHTRWPSAKIVCVNIDQNYAADAPYVYAPATFNAFIAGLPATYPTFVTVVDVNTITAFSSLYAGDGLHIDHPHGNWLVARQIWNGIKIFL